VGFGLRRLTVVVAGALAVAACGSASGGGSTTGRGAAAQAVQHALAAIQKRAYHETFAEHVALDTSRLPPAEVNALSSVGGTISGTAEVTNSRNFRIVVTLHGQRVYVRAVGGQLSISQDGVKYQPAPAATAQRFSQLVNLAPGILNHVTNARSLGSAQVSGQAVSRYSATIPASAVSPAFSTLGASAGTPGALKLTVYVSNASGLPVRLIDDESATEDLSKLGHPGVTGKLSVTVTGVRDFTYR
jgi:hypothetical protein